MIYRTLFALPILSAAILSAALHAQTQAGGAMQPIAHHEAALRFDYARSNAPVGGSASFDLYGGGGDVGWRIGRSPFSLVADVSVTHASNISTSKFDLTQTVVTGGARYTPHWKPGNWSPFAQAAVGLAHSAGSLTSGSNANVGNAGAAFAAKAGGGLDRRLSPHLSWRMAEASYLYTGFDNGSNNHQNDLQLSTGLVLTF